MKQLLLILLTLSAALPALAQRNTQLPGDVGAPIPRSRPLQGQYRAVVVNGFVKYQDYLGNLIDPATVFNIVSTTAGSGTVTGGISQSFADSRYRQISTPINYQSDLTGKPTSLSAFTNDPGYQTAAQVNTAIGAATTPLSQSISQNSSDIAGKLSTGTYTTNRATDQAATTVAQNTANTALTTANSATAALGNKVDKATTITVNGVSQSLSGPVSFTVAGTNSTTLTQVSQLSNDANYQSGAQVGAAISSAVSSVTTAQQTTDNNQTLSISQKLSTTTFNSYTGTQAATDQAQSTSIAQNASDIANRLLTSTYTTNRSSDQAATTSAQNTANTALTTANSATAAAATNANAITGKVDKATTISVNGSTPQSLTGNVSITIPVGTTSAGTNFVLASASPYVPVSTSGNSATITDGLSAALGIPVFVRDQASIQALINSLPTSTTAIPRLLFFGKYDFSANANTPLTVSKNIEMIGMNGASFDGGTTNGFLMKFNNISTRMLVENITFRSRSTTSAYALVYANEEFGDANNVTFRNVRFHAPAGNYNAFGANAHNGTTGVYYRNWTFDNCVVDSVGRMGYEILSQKNDGVIRITNLVFNNCQANNVGLYNPAGVTKASAQINGMGWSISGDIQDVTFNNPISRNSLVGIELVSTRNVNIINPKLSGPRSSTYSDAGVLPATGISMTDGGSTDRGVLNRAATNINITGGTIDMSGKAFGTYYVDGVRINGVQATGGAYLEFQHAKRLMITGLQYEMTGKNYIASFEDVKDSQIRSSTFSRAANTVTPIYQPINTDANTANTVFSDISIVTNTTLNSGNPDNYFNDQQPFRLRYINEAGTNNSIKDIYLNGQKMPDAVYELIPTLTITAAGTVSALTHIARININPASTIASLNLTLPPTTQDDKRVEVVIGGALTTGTVATSLSINGPSGAAIVQSNTPTSGTAGQTFIYKYNALTGKYHRY